MERWAAKLLAVVILFVIIFGSTLLPIKVSDVVRRQGQRGIDIISCMMCFGGGVFLSVYTMHMAPDSRAIVEESITGPNNIQYPLSDFIMMCGFFGMLFLDTAVHRYKAKRRRLQQTSREGSGQQVRCQKQKMITCDNGPIYKKQRSNQRHHQHPHQYQQQHMLHEAELHGLHNSNSDGKTRHEYAYRPASPCKQVTGTGPLESVVVVTVRQTRRPVTVTSSGRVDRPKMSGKPSNARGPPTRIDDGGKSPPAARYALKDGQLVPNDGGDGPTARDEKPDRLQLTGADGDSEARLESDEETQDLTKSLVLLIALSLHHVFEGLGIGLKRTVSDVWSLFAAITAHEIVIAFSLGMQMVKMYRKTRHVVLAAAACSAMVPLGVIAGMIMTEAGHHHESNAVLVANGILQSLATGVFIYVTFFEILQPELGAQEDNPSFVKLFFMLAGFICLALMALIPENKSTAYDEPYYTISPLAANFTL